MRSMSHLVLAGTVLAATVLPMVGHASPIVARTCSQLFASNDQVIKHLTTVSEAVGTGSKKERATKQAEMETFVRLVETDQDVPSDIREAINQSPVLNLYVLSKKFALDLAAEDIREIEDAAKEFLASHENKSKLKTLEELDSAVDRALLEVRKRQLLVNPDEKSKLTLRERLRQIAALPATFRKIREFVKEELSFERMDENLWAFRGFHEQPTVAHYRARSYDNPSIVAKAAPDQVDMDRVEFANYARVSMEIEDPIEEYSRQSGQSLRFVLPNFARYMGSTNERLEYISKEGNKNYCEAPWCREESRHGNTWAKIFQIVTGRVPNRDNPNDVEKLDLSETSALDHVVSRMTTEWNASTVYAVIATHTHGPMKEAIMNMARDEFKHFTIVSSAYTYLNGVDHMRRFWHMAKVAYGFLTYHNGERSGGSGMSSNKISAIEFIYAHIQTERALRRFLNRLPLKTMRAVFDGPSAVEVLPTTPLSDETKAQYAKWEREQALKRVNLDRWSPKARVEALMFEDFMRDNKETIDKIIATSFHNFKGAEDESSAESMTYQEKLRFVAEDLSNFVPHPTSRDKRWYTKAIADSLRDYQIRNNWYTRKRAADQAAKQAKNGAKN